MTEPTKCPDCGADLTWLDHDARLRHMADHRLIAERDAALEKAKELQKIVNRLHRTRDEVPVIGGDSVYVWAEGRVHKMTVCGNGGAAVGLTYSHVTCLCYSTPEAAEATKGSEP